MPCIALDRQKSNLQVDETAEEYAVQVTHVSVESDMVIAEEQCHFQASSVAHF